MFGYYRMQWHIYLLYLLALINSLSYPITGYFSIRFLVLYFSLIPETYEKIESLDSKDSQKESYF